MVAAAKFLRKWLWCSWHHRKHRCYPTVWGPAEAREMGIRYRPNTWHCAKCHPCGEWLDKIEAALADKEAKLKGSKDESA